MNPPEASLLEAEYHETNAHLRANMTQFVNWFSFFLTISFAAAAFFPTVNLARPELRRGIAYGIQIVTLLLHILADLSPFFPPLRSRVLGCLSLAPSWTTLNENPPAVFASGQACLT